MEIRNILKKSAPLAVIIILAAVARIVPHAPNFAPIGGLALFTGYHFKNKFTWGLPLTAMVISDIFIGFHSTVPYVYASFFIISIIGSYMKNINAKSLFTTSLVSSFLFFIITNFGVWATGTMYTSNFSGLMQSYVLGIPFFRNTLFGDFFYTFSFFYGFKYLNAYVLKMKIFGKSA